ncbi:uncharacterized protein EDB91DRAFT_1246941 [Suillus paluster]|uniref:uncharacterized protein n=1 Tax=Suillus paluster TaxID=48578 RepID=UPI001B865078|nr:uncharacterized protein EDB91DRAFT_1246941 [Suillus paluster]KAG1744062.1 hypothetical protein EDB91DRAFT_1246941 [Suillus paluster]
MIARLHAMYQRSKKVFIFLVVIFLAANIANGVITVIIMRYISAEVLILWGTYHCNINIEGDAHWLLTSIIWIIATVWEILALCLAVWIAVKHFRELRRQSTGGILADCFTVLMKTHVVYFASVVIVSCFQFCCMFSPILADYSTSGQIYIGVIEILKPVPMFVLGPRLILGIREYHAKLVADSDAATAMTSIAFQERVTITTSSGM